MKKIIALALLSFSTMATIQTGEYILDRIECKNGKTLKLGGSFMKYNVHLKVAEESIQMTAIAKSADWAPYILNCTQVNTGSFTQVGPGQYQGELEITNVKCNMKMWEGILKKQHFGVESKDSIFDYEHVNGQLKLSVADTATNYKTCKESNSSPVYFYNKK